MRRYTIFILLWLLSNVYGYQICGNNYKGYLFTLKVIEKVFVPKIVPEGDGARVMRVIGTKDLPRLDPFLMLDYFFVKLPAGFPDHPHRGFETVTYLQEGKIYHEDFKGNKGVLEPGTCQWMTAGKGIVHAEMPGSFDEETIGLQLWINLPKAKKLTDPAYQEIGKSSIPLYNKDGISAKVISGDVLGVRGPIFARQPAIFIDFQLDAGAVLDYNIPENWNALLFVFKGEAYVGSDEKLCTEKSTVHLKKDVNTLLHVTTKKGCSFALIAGEPLNEPISQYGPFVMNTQDEIQQAFKDYQSASNGFEGADTWKSEIRKLSKKK